MLCDLNVETYLKMKPLLCKNTSTIDINCDKLHKEVPESEEDFTPKWCEVILKRENIIDEQVTVDSVKLSRLSENDDDLADGGGLTDAQIIRLELSYGGKVDGSEPSTLIAKWFHKLSLQFSLKWRLMLRMNGEEYGGGLEEIFYRNDILFYRDALAIIKDKFQHPKVIYTGMIDNGNRNFWNGVVLNKPCNVKSITIMQDMKGWKSTNVIENFKNGGLDREQHEACFENIAIFHAAFWDNDMIKQHHTLKYPCSAEKEHRVAAHSKQALKSRNKKISTTKSCQRLIEKFKSNWAEDEWMMVSKGITMPSWFTAEPLSNGSQPVFQDPLVIEMIEVFAERYPNFNTSIASKYLKKPMQTLLHGDFHQGNHMYGVNENKGKVVCFDFQGVGMGRVATEFVYFCNLMPDISDISNLAKVYHNALVANGVKYYYWDNFKEDLIIQFGESALKTIIDGSELKPKIFKEWLSMYGEKAKSFEKLFDLGVFGWNLVILTDLYVKNKDGFLNPDTFGDI